MEYKLTDHLGSTRMTYKLNFTFGAVYQNATIQYMADYYSFGKIVREYINPGTSAEKYQYTGKERDTESGYDYFNARNYHSEVGRFLSVDPLAGKYPSWSPYNYTMNNPIRFIDPSGMEVEGDIYNKNGVHIGNDGKVDNKVYFKSTIDDSQMAQQVALNATNMASTTTGVSSTIDITSSTGITHDEFLQYAANVYNEAKDQSYTEKEKVASAINNRKDGHSLGGSWTETLDKIMSSKDSHRAKMDPSRIDPNSTDVLAGTTSVLLNNIRTGNYQDFINASNTDRGSNIKMSNSVKATLNGLLGSDKVNKATEWRGRRTYNKFGKEGSFK